jgi:hypothetical protein
LGAARDLADLKETARGRGQHARYLHKLVQ